MTAREAPSPRLPLIDDPADPRLRAQFDALAAGGGILNLHRTMAHAPALMLASGDMAQAFRREAALARSIAELAVLRTAQVVDSPYVWTRHLPLARACGVSEQQIEAIARWRESKAFSPAEKAALGFAEHAARHEPFDDASFAELRRHFSPREIVELAMLVGFYVSTAIFIKALAVPNETA
jgi:alkylhydroperoxidase family enzyme